ncbi:MAG: exopolysaccharide biosynthesis polyprenyl glycosylphosphotransferase [Candidatus Krumholzibacteriota bacterium]|nr:exopolysaccharide biosynthesis polyprenyl glycosylphosphotransferase [Candidatus Krumholzibacteriota bacterium]
MRKYSLALDSTIKSQHQAEPLKNRPLLEVRERSNFERFVKRSFDVVASLAVLVLGFPFFLAIGLLIKLTSRGPVFFKQQRVGENGELFFLYKFRSMKAGNDDSIHREFAQNFIQGATTQSSLDEKPEKLYKIADDPRVTAIGSFLRRSSLDELPQFINILKGEMSIVGPRPPMEYEYEHYDNWHKLRLKVRPGLTGLWQVSGRSTVPFQEMVMLDLYYIEHWSLKMDINIMVKTVPVMLSGTGGY